jgi:predicted dehydrogenase
MLKIGLIGCGNISRYHLYGWKRINGAELTAVCDTDSERAKQRAREFDVPNIYTDLIEMIEREKLDCVDIATRTDTHLDIVRTAADTGVDILCQKPFSFDFKGAAETVRMCREKGITLMIHQNFRFQPFIRHIKKLIDSGELGSIFYGRIFHRLPYCVPNTVGRTQMLEREPYIAEEDRLLLRHMVIHHFDNARYLLGDPRSIYAITKRIDTATKGENMVNVLLNYEDAVCYIEESWISRGIEEIGFHIEGEKATIFVDGEVFTLTRSNGTKTVIPLSHLYPEIYETGNIDCYSFQAAQQHFIDSLNNNTEPETSGEDNLKSLALIFAGYESAEQNKVVGLQQ